MPLAVTQHEKLILAVLTLIVVLGFIGWAVL